MPVCSVQVLLEDLGFTHGKAMTIHTDNYRCIVLSRNPVSHSRVKHIDIQHHFICEHMENSKMDLKFCFTKDMVADIFTKPLAQESFERFWGTLGVGA
jgi:hypothetical protein